MCGAHAREWLGKRRRASVREREYSTVQVLRWNTTYVLYTGTVSVIFSLGSHVFFSGSFETSCYLLCTYRRHQMTYDPHIQDVSVGFVQYAGNKTKKRYTVVWGDRNRRRCCLFRDDENKK